MRKGRILLTLGLVILLTLIAGIGFASATQSDPKAGVGISPDTKGVAVGDIFTLNISVTPEEG